MQDNSANRRKTLIISVLLFLFAGGGIFLFFVVQGSNDLTRQGKNQNFTYGEAAREGVSSFFRSVGVVSDEESLLAEKTAKVSELREEKSAELAGVSDWMAPAGGPSASASSGGGYRPSASPSSVPKMAAGPSAQVGGGGGGSKSAGSVSRFGEGSQQGATSISNKTGDGAGTTPGKGTLGSLKRAQALLGEGLRSDSAMTANAKWNQSFGVGSGSNRGGGDLAYNKGGLVSLDKIKSGEISSLKMDKKGAAFSPDPSKPDMDKDGTKAALKADKNVQKAEDKLKSDIAKEAASKAVEAAGPGAGGDKKDPGGNDKSAPPPSAVLDAARGVTLRDADMGGGAKYSDDNVKVERGEGGNFKATYNGTYTDADGNKTSIKTTATISPTGEILGLGF